MSPVQAEVLKLLPGLAEPQPESTLDADPKSEVPKFTKPAGQDLLVKAKTGTRQNGELMACGKKLSTQS